MPAPHNKKSLSLKKGDELLEVLESRFLKHMQRHSGLEWITAKSRLLAAPEKLWSLHELERTGGDPDVIGHDSKTGGYLFVDCSAESPKGRVSVGYDRTGLDWSRGRNPNLKIMRSIWQPRWRWKF